VPAKNGLFSPQRLFLCAKLGGAAPQQTLELFAASPNQIGSGEHVALVLDNAFFLAVCESA
jgi:hypothetical protein